MNLTFTEQLQQFFAAHTVLIFAWIALFFAVLYNFYKGATSKYHILDNAQATQKINREDAVVVDLRSDDEFRSGHIIESINLHPTDIKNQKIQLIEKYKDKPIILVDATGVVANANAEALVKQGFSNVNVLKDGMNGWRSASLPTVRKK